MAMVSWNVAPCPMLASLHSKSGKLPSNVSHHAQKVRSRENSGRIAKQSEIDANSIEKSGYGVFHRKKTSARHPVCGFEATEYACGPCQASTGIHIARTP
jgi:hypothetical protein